MKRLTEEKKNEIVGIIAIISGLIFTLNLFLEETGTFGTYAEEFLELFLGRLGIFVIPLLFFYAGYLLLRHKKIEIGIKALGIFMIILTILSLFHRSIPPGEEFNEAMRGYGGGILGGGFLWALRSLFSEMASVIIIIGVGLIGVLLWTEKTLTNTLQSIKTYRQNRKSRQEEKRQAREARKQEKLALKEEKKKAKEQEREERGPAIELIEEPEPERPPKRKSRKKKETKKETRKEQKPTMPPEEEEPFPVAPQGEYSLPPLQLLKEYATGKQKPPKDQSALLEKTMADFGIEAAVIEQTHGPRISRYEVQPSPGIKVSRIVALADDIALALAAQDIRIEAPIPGKSALGIEVPHNAQRMVGLKEIVGHKEFLDNPSKLSLVLGLDISGTPVVKDLRKMPHLLVAGATGSGKSVSLNIIILSILYKAAPHQVKMVLIDPKQVELTSYEKLPHLVTPIVKSPKKAAGALHLMVEEMERRYQLFSETGVRGIEEFNEIKQMEGSDEEVLPSFVVIIDELADLMMVAANEVEASICRLAQKARAAGIHLIIATQRPSVDVITGLIKVNVPSRISFYVSSQVDSRTILDTGGAEKLMGEGDMLFSPVGASKPVRIQAPYVSGVEIKQVVEYIARQFQEEEGEGEEKTRQYMFEPETVEESAAGSTANQKDEMYEEAVKLVVENKMASISMLQRRLSLGYNRAARLIDMMEEDGVVGPFAGTKPRKVILQKENLKEFLEGE